MRVRGYLGPTAALISGASVLAACAHGGPPPPPPPPPASMVLHGDAAGAGVVTVKPAQPPRTRAKGGLIDPSCRYCVTDDPAKRQYFDQRRNRYYYFDRAKKAYFWENGDPKA